MKVTTIQLLDQLIDHCYGIHEIDAVDIPHIMRSFYKEAKGIPQFINMMEAAQSKANRANILITDKYIHALALQTFFASNEYEVDTREWEKLPAQEQTWKEGKKKFCVEYAEKKRGEKSWDSVDQPFSGTVEAIPIEDSIPEG